MAGLAARRWRLEPIVFAALLAAHVVPLWALAHVPTQDGPAHVENAMALLRLSRVPVLAEYYELRPRLVPNWSSQALLVVLLRFLPPVAAEKVLWTGYVAGLPLAFRWALPERARRRGFAVAIFPFVAGFAFHMGFANFCWSLVFFFLALGHWWRGRGRLGWRRGLGLGGLLLLLALSHAVSLVVFVATVACVLLGRAGRAVRRRGVSARRRRVCAGYARMAAAAILAAAPALALVAGLVVAGADGHTLRWLPLSERVLGLAVLRSLVTIEPGEVWITAGIAGAIAVGVVAALARRRSGAEDRGWLAAAAGTLALALVAPNEFGSGWAITPRLQVFPFALALVWIGARPALPALGRAVPALVVFASVLLLAVRAPGYVHLGAAIEEYVSVGAHVARGTVLLPLQLTTGRVYDGRRWIPAGFAPVLHASGYIAAERDVVDLTNYAAATGYFPLRYRPGRDPYVHLGHGRAIEGEGALPCADLDAGGSGIRVDYVLVWGPPALPVRDACVEAWQAQLVRDYDLVNVSTPTGRAQLWKRR